MTFFGRLTEALSTSGSYLCVGLDSDCNKLPKQFTTHDTPQYAFNCEIIDATAPYTACYKPNSAFYEARGSAGIHELKLTCDYIKTRYPEKVIILDAKRADIGNTNAGYVEFAYDYLEADAITLHPYLGREALAPFLDRADKGAIILCHTSNPGAGELQEVPILDEVEDVFGSGAIRSQDGVHRFQVPSEQVVSADTGEIATVPYYLYLARQIARSWNTNNNCMLVIGATYPDEMRLIRDEFADLPFLVPGVGAQGGDLATVLDAGQNSTGTGVIINASRSIIFASRGDDFAAAAAAEAEKLRNEMMGE